MKQESNLHSPSWLLVLIFKLTYGNRYISHNDNIEYYDL